MWGGDRVEVPAEGDCELAEVEGAEVEGAAAVDAEAGERIDVLHHGTVLPSPPLLRAPHRLRRLQGRGRGLWCGLSRFFRQSR